MNDIQSQIQPLANSQPAKQVVKRPVKQTVTQPKTEQTTSQRPYYEFPKHMNEKEIDLSTLFYEVLSHLKTILLITVIGMVLGALVGFLLYHSRSNFEPSEYELARINNANSLYNKYKSSVNGTTNNFVTSLDATREDYVQKTMTYYIHMDDDSYINMATNIFNMKTSSAYLDELQVITGFTGTKNTLSPVLYSSVQIIDNDNSTFLLNAESASSNDINLKEDYAVLTVVITYLTEEQCDKFSKYVENNINTIVSTNKTIYPGLSATKISDNVLGITSEFISSALATLKDEEYEAITEYHDLIKGMSSDEMFYYNQHYDPDEAETLLHSILKYAILCGIGAAVILAARYAFLFTASGIVVNENELISEYGLNIIGRVRIRPENKGLARKFQKKIHESSIDDCEPEYIANVLSMCNPAKIYVIATDADLYYIKEDTIPVFIDAMSEVSSIPIVSGSLITDANMIRSAKLSAGVCMLVIPGVTKDNELRAQLAICNKHKIFVQGIIVLR